MGGECGTNGNYEEAYKVFVGKAEGRDDLEDLGVGESIY
jgi:hypothetical protein